MARRSYARTLTAAASGALFLVVAAKAVARLYYDPALVTLAGWWVPPDGGTFIVAGIKVLSGESPYADATNVGTDLGYVYPPLLAFLISPLSAFSGTTAAMLWSLALVACVIGALWLLSVRDWRCYPVALFWPFNRDALEFGAIDPLLLLAVAACWRFRDEAWRGPASAGLALALKLFLWPIVVWFALTERFRSTGRAVFLAGAFVVLPWALIAFQGFLDYPQLLRATANQWERTYSVAALGHALGAPKLLADAISLFLGLGLLAVAFVTARGRSSTRYARDRLSLTFVLLASLAFTPVVWTHYFLLLLVPVALARPRLSLAWIIPLLGTAFYLFDWYRPHPEGELLPLIAVASIVLTVLATCMWQRELELERAWALGSRQWIVGHLPRSARYQVAAASLVLLLAFIAVPEMLGDRPYDPRPSAWLGAVESRTLT